MKKFLGILVLCLLVCKTGFSVESLTEDQKGKINFQSVPVITLNQFLNGETGGKTIKISGSLKFPKKEWTGRLPAVVLLHGGGGPRASVKYWSKTLRKIGLATFVVDSNTTRGCPASTPGTCMLTPSYGSPLLARSTDSPLPMTSFYFWPVTSNFCSFNICQ